MKEWCGCGAGIEGKPRQVKRWRTEHRHPEPTPEREPEKGGSTSSVQVAGYPLGFVRRDDPAAW